MDLMLGQHLKIQHEGANIKAPHIFTLLCFVTIKATKIEWDEADVW